MSKLNLIRAGPEQRQAIENMMQLYAHDFSDQWTGTEKGELDDNGRYCLPSLDAFWCEPGYEPLLLRAEQHLAGFALLNQSSKSGLPVNHNMAEFFVVKKYRRLGLGADAVGQIFATHRGQWETAVAAKNIAAQGFWRRVTARFPGTTGLQELQLEHATWNGPVLPFKID